MGVQGSSVECHDRREEILEVALVVWQAQWPREDEVGRVVRALCHLPKAQAGQIVRERMWLGSSETAPQILEDTHQGTRHPRVTAPIIPFATGVIGQRDTHMTRVAGCARDVRVDRCREMLCAVVVRGGESSSRSLRQVLRVNSSARDEVMFQWPPKQDPLMRTRSPGAIDRICRPMSARCERAGDCPFARSSREVHPGRPRQCSGKRVFQQHERVRT